MTFSGGRGVRPSVIARTAGLGAVAIVAFALLGCGSDSSDSDSTATVGDYVAAKDIRRYPPGTPQRTVLQWWKAVQFGNPTVANSYYAPGMGPGLRSLERKLAAASNQFSGIPDFNSVEKRRARATLYFFVSRPETSTPPRPVSINMVNKGGEWGLADDQLLSQVVERVNRAQAPPS